MTDRAAPPAPTSAEEAADPFRRLAEHAPVGIVESDLEGNLVTVNAAWREISGCTIPTPIPFADVRGCVHPDERRRITEMFVASATQREPFDTRTRLQRPDGEVRDVRMQGSPLLDGNGALRGFVGTVFDVTALVAADEARRRSDRRYRDLIANAPVGQAVYDLRGRLVEVNRAWSSLLGYEPDDVVGTRAADYIHPDDRPAVLAVVDRLLDGSLPVLRDERRLLHHDGHPVHVSSSITVERDQHGEPVSFHSMIVDLSERVEADAALRTSEANLRDIVSALHDGVLVLSADHLEMANPAALELLGCSLEELQDPATFEAFDSIRTDGSPIRFEDRAPIVAMRTRRPVTDEVVGMLLPGRGRRWFSVNARPRFADDRVIGAVLSFSDITERKEAEDRLRDSEARFRTLAESLPVGVYWAGRDGHLVYVNPTWHEITGIRSADEYDEAHALARVHPEDRPRFRQLLREAIGARRSFRTQYRTVDEDGTIRWISARGAPTHDDETGEITGFIGSMEDITALVAAQEETGRLAGIVESTSDLVGIAEYPSLRLTYLNRSARELFGVEVDGQLDVGAIYADDARDTFFHRVVPVLERGATWSGELRMRAADGRLLDMWQTLAAERDGDGTIVQVSAVGRDVTERRRLEADLAHRATHDALTGLPNRALLLDHLGLALARTERDGLLVAVLFLDLDRFKQVNDSLGHRAGDELLVEVARRIDQVLRPADTVARLGGDEFVVLCEHVDDEHHAVAIAQRINATIAAEPVVLDGTEVNVSASIGIALASSDVAHPEALLRDADAAMYRAKELGRARLELFDESMRRRTAARLELADQLADAIEQGRIAVHFQPAVDLATGRVTSVEALARWDHPERGVLAPAEFIELAEETGLIVGLGLSVLGLACEAARSWLDHLGDDAPTVHVNLSARQLSASNLPLLVRTVLDRTGLPPQRLCLEITESTLMEDAATAVDTLRALKAIGVSLAIDDFGTGYSSLSYLRRFPVDVLKIDRTFVAGLAHDDGDAAIVAAVIGLARTLELTAIAEGVETADQAARLRDLGCGAAQGFHFARPVPTDELPGLLEQTFPV